MINDHELLTQRRLQRAVLARQHLLTRATTDIVAVVRDVCGLQTQYAPTAYVGLWSRLDGFQRADLTAALEQRSVVQATLVRNTIHVVAATDYWPHRLAVGDVMRRWFLRLPGHPTERTMRAAADRVHKALAGGGEVTRKELDRLASPARVPTSGCGWTSSVLHRLERGNGGVPTATRSPRNGSALLRSCRWTRPETTWCAAI